MKHIDCISRVVPARAVQAQDVICDLAHQLALMIEVKGGSLPLVSYLDAKCQVIPVTPPV
jgi:hypothetical protein